MPFQVSFESENITIDLSQQHISLEHNLYELCEKGDVVVRGVTKNADDIGFTIDFSRNFLKAFCLDEAIARLLKNEKLSLILNMTNFLQRIQAIIISSNELSHFPRCDTVILGNIDSLYVNHNKIQDLPPSYWFNQKFPNLKNLDLRSNTLFDTPFLEGFKCPLETLSLSGNRLKTVTCLPRMDKLRLLGLFSCEISDTPREIAQTLSENFPNLNELTIGGNPTVSIVDSNLVSELKMYKCSIKRLDCRTISLD
eukprot:GDKJ01035686.1.p1 GENE.GDKJ01035686.1~~GDKJ01035686.1.p1  ORF type:complete len:254 (+),score=40.68 GDKJ01035686.1:30-791(+)